VASVEVAAGVVVVALLFALRNSRLKRLRLLRTRQP
jgi:hypothetical protein